MAKETGAWMPFYVGDYLGDTQRLTTEQHGAYLLLILDYWRNGPAPDDDAVLQQITKLERAAWKRHRPALARMFQIVDGEWRHKRIDRELGRASENVDRRTKGARDGADAKWGDSADGKKGRELRSQRLAAARQIATHTPAEWERLKDLCGNVCVRCGFDGPLVKDHIQPIYQGGSDGIDNLQPLCRPCNSSKGPEAIDHRPNGWRDAFKMPPKMPASASAPPSPSPSPYGDTVVDDACARADVAEIASELCRAAGIRHLEPAQIIRHQTLVRGWLGEGFDPQAEIIPAVRQAIADATERISSLQYFDRSIRQFRARQEAHANGHAPRRKSTSGLGRTVDAAIAFVADGGPH